MTDDTIRKELQRLPVFGLVMDFCRLFVLRILDKKLYNTRSYDPNGLVYQKAIFEMFLRDPRNIEAFVLEDYDDIRFSEHKGKKNKSGKIIKLESVRADLVRRQTKYIKV